MRRDSQKYSGESHSNRRILMRDKWSYCALLKVLGKTRGAWHLLQRRALNRITGRGWKIPQPFLFFLSLCFSHISSRSPFCSCPLSFSLSFPTLCHIYHLILPALTVLLSSLLPCHPQWFNVLSHGNHRINLCQLVVWLNVQVTPVFWPHIGYPPDAFLYHSSYMISMG